MNRYFATIAAIFGLDLGTKYMVKKYIPLGSRKNLIENRFSFHHIKNKGMAYNTGEQNPKFVLWLSTALATFCFGQFCVLLFQRKQRNSSLLMAIAIMLGGAFGNLWERWRYGSVTDFLYIHAKRMPIFNVADVAILLGGIGAMLASLWKK